MTDRIGAEVQDFLEFSVSFLQDSPSEKRREMLVNKAQALLAKPWSFPKIWTRHPDALDFAREVLEDESHRVEIDGKQYSMVFMPFSIRYETSDGQLKVANLGSDAAQFAEETFIPGTILARHAFSFGILNSYNPHQLHELLIDIIKNPETAGEELDPVYHVTGENIHQYVFALAMPTWNNDEIAWLTDRAGEADYHNGWIDHMQGMLRDLSGNVDINFLQPGMLYEIETSLMLSSDLMRADAVIEGMQESLDGTGGGIYVSLSLVWAEAIIGPTFRIHIQAHNSEGNEISSWEHPIYGGGGHDWSDSLGKILKFLHEEDFANVRIQNLDASEYHGSWMRSGGLHLH